MTLEIEDISAPGRERIPLARTGGRSAGPIDRPNRLRHLLSAVVPKISGGRQLFAGDLIALVVLVAVWEPAIGILAGGWLLTVLSLLAGGLYRPRLHLSLLDQLPQLVGRSVPAMAAAAAVPIALGMPFDQRGFLFGAVSLVGGMVVVRGVLFRLIRMARDTGLVGHNTLLVGDGAHVRKVAEILSRHRTYGLRLVGCLSDRTPLPGTGDLHLGGTNTLSEVVRRERVRVVIVDESSVAADELLDGVRGDDRVSAMVLPGRWRIGGLQPSEDHIGAVPVYRLHPPGRSAAHRICKRLFDIVMAVAGLTVLFPLMALTALVICCSDGRGPIFRQVRVGRGGRLFTMYKFRSMKPVASDLSDTSWTSDSAPRIGRVGRFIRRTSIDELPQLVNILRGDMTFVGPRPERPFYVERFSAMFPEYRSRHRVNVGLTGLAQVSGLRGDTSIDDRVRHDNYYIDHWSLWFDVKVLVWTLGQAFGARGS